MNRKSIVTVLLAIAVYPLLGCNHVKDEEAPKHPSDSIVLIFKNFHEYPHAYSAIQGITITNPDPPITVTDAFHSIFYSPDTVAKSDTLRINPTGQTILVKHVCNVIQYLEFIIGKGDTAVFTYSQGIPECHILNSTVDANIELNWQKKAVHDSAAFDPYNYYRLPMLYTSRNDNMVSVLGRVNEVRSKFAVLAKQYFVDEGHYLDSMKAAGRLSHPAYLYYKDKLQYSIAKIDYERNLMSKDSAHRMIRANMGVDSGLPYSYFYPLLEEVVDSSMEKGSRVLLSANGKEYDFREVYDKIEKWQDINDMYKKLLLQKYLKKIFDIFPVSEAQRYFNRFSQFTHDSILINDIAATYMLKENSSPMSKDSVYLSNDKNEHTTLASVLKQYKGQVVYIDFWASWCAPCRVAMPGAAKLRKEYADKKVAFVYISIDKSKSQWAGAEREEHLGAATASFILLNVDSSSLMKELNVSSIPRYLLFDKSGRLVHKNAPNPTSGELKPLINSLLTK